MTGGIMTAMLLLLTTSGLVAGLDDVFVDVTSFGAVPGDSGDPISNTAAFNKALAEIPAGKVLLVNETFNTIGGINASNRSGITVQLDGSIVGVPKIDAWPRPSAGQYAHIVHFINCTNITIRGQGYIQGNGPDWWFLYTLGDCGLLRPKNSSICPHRPKALVIEQSSYIHVSGITSVDSPSFNIQVVDGRHAEIDHVTVITELVTIQKIKSQLRRWRLNKLGLTSDPPGLQPEDLNTDGIDASGFDIWIHDVSVQNDDDSFAVKPCSQSCWSNPCTENVLIENSYATGFGASVGSVPPHTDHNCVKNITFRNITMEKTGKGVYIKSNPECEEGSTAEITNIVYENMTIIKPEWWPIWIGPQQQQEPGDELGDKCSLFYPVQDSCPTQGCVSFTNITLRQIIIKDPWFSPGVILGNETNPMTNVVFDGVIFTFEDPNNGKFPFGRSYKTEFAHGVATGGTFPDPGLLP